MKNGATIIFDMALLIEKYILECHGGPVTSIDFFEDRSIITGSTVGTVHLHEVEEGENVVKLKISNVQDERIPIAKVQCSSFGIAMALDVKGNLRFYDMIRFKKMCKVMSTVKKSDTPGMANTEIKNAFRILPNICLETEKDLMVIINNTLQFSEPNFDE